MARKQVVKKTKKIKQVVKRVRIVVTQKNIDRGRKGDGWGCPIARALEDQQDLLEDWDDRWFVNEFGEVRRTETGRPIYHLPRSVQRFINRFDKGDLVKPFTFLMTKVCEGWANGDQ